MKLQAPKELACPECKWPFEPNGFGHPETCTIGRRYKLPQFVTGHRLLVFGSRTVPLTRYYLGIGALDQQLATNPDLSIMHGGAKGADNLAKEWANAQGVATEVWHPQYSLFPSWLAPLWRNAEMAARLPQEGVGLIGPCDKVKHRTWPPHPSHGSVDMALRLRELGIPVIPHCWDFPGNLEDFLGVKELQ